MLILSVVSSVFADYGRQGDALYAYRGDPSRYRDALTFYERDIQADPKNPELHWKASMAAWWLGTRTTDRAQKLGYFRQGRVYGEKAVALSPRSAEAHFWLSGNFASYGHAKGAWTSLFLIGRIRHHAELSAHLDERYQGGGAYRILALLDSKVPGFVGGNKRRALERFEKALAVDPANPITRFYLAEYYLDLGDKEKARTEFGLLEQLVVPEPLLPEYEMILEERTSLEKKLAL